MNVRTLLTVRGRVQGVSFRKQTMKMAQQLNVSGWVKNQPDGTVQGCFEGSESSVEALIAWCTIGPDRAIVTSVKRSNQAYLGEFDGFAIHC